ncbi:unnamed protein product [Durusdinium trenchii]|uniref:Uncharacterized protein n=1 Tax=Durusdinium trenchii TaxID=1381693 RepID=A0ABP0N1W8_9DINO
MCPALLDGTKLPMSLQSLRISGRFPKTLEEMVFPGGLQDLTLGDGFQSCQGLKLPSGLKSLTFGRCFNRALSQSPPSSCSFFPSGRILGRSKPGRSAEKTVEHMGKPDGLLAGLRIRC